jgi:hypothetical protein
LKVGEYDRTKPLTIDPTIRYSTSAQSHAATSPAFGTVASPEADPLSTRVREIMQLHSAAGAYFSR